MAETNNPKAKINILGSCISRDLFHYQENDGGYKISKYSNEFDVFHINEPPLTLDKTEFDKIDISSIMSPFVKRCFYLDITKKTLDYIKEDIGDYLIIDSAVCRFPGIRINETTIAFTKKRMQLLSLLNKNHLIDPPRNTEEILPLDEMEIRLKDFTNEVLKLYPPDRIILIDIRSSFFHDDGQEIHPFKTPEKWIQQNKRMETAFKILKKQLNGCHVIPFPEAIASDTNHWLKVAVLHYTKAYYDYAFRCIETIMEHLPMEQEQSIIQQKCDECSMWYYSTYYTRLAIEYAKKDELLKKEQRTSRARDLQAKFFRDLCLKSGGAEKYFSQNHYNKIILYGWTRISEYLLSLSHSSDIEILCVLENMKAKTIGGHLIKGGIPVIPRSSSIPDGDCIVITDLLNKEKIISSLRLKTALPVVTDDDLLAD